VGVYEKQAACYCGATSALATVEANIMWALPRAAVNFNDGMGGGNAVRGNLAWATCRETQDHGPFKCVCRRAAGGWFSRITARALPVMTEAAAAAVAVVSSRPA
jgi:hypothetical protein